MRIDGFKGKLPILSSKALPENYAVEAKNCDLRGNSIRPLQPYNAHNIGSNYVSKLFFLSNSDYSSFKTLALPDGVSASPTPTINDDRVVFILGGGPYSPPKKATLADIISPIEFIYTDVENLRNLGVPAPDSPLILEKEATYTNYSDFRIYYEGDILQIHDPSGGDYTNFYIICVASSSIGSWEETFSWNKNETNWWAIPRFHDIPIHWGGLEGTDQDVFWIFNESSGGETEMEHWTVNTEKVLEKDWIIHYTDNHLYRAKFNNINRNRPDDPDCWAYLMDFTELWELHLDPNDYQINLYDDSRVYNAGEIALIEWASYDGSPLYWWCVCNRAGTQGVNPITSLDVHTGRWGIICAWSKKDMNLPYGQTTLTDEHGAILPVDIGGSTVNTIFPYYTTYPHGKNNWYCLYPYVNDEGTHRFGLFQTKRESSNIRPFNPAFGGENPWELWKHRDEIAIDRSEVYDTVAYTWTYVTDWGEESKPAPVTEVVDARMSEMIKFKTPISSFPDGQIAGFRVYRLSSGERSAEYMLFQNEDFDSNNLDEWIEDKNSYISHIKPATDLVQEVLQTEDWNSPKDDLKGFVTLSNGCIVGFRNNEIYFSEPWVYYAYPYKYQIITQNSIVGLGSFGDTVVACTQSNPEVITCPSPGQTSVVVSAYPYQCLSSRSIVSLHNAVVYASNHGLIAVDGSAVPQNITRNLIHSDSWFNDYEPNNIAGVFYKEAYWGVITGTSKGFIVPFGDEGYTIDLDMGDAGIVNITGIEVDPYFGLLLIMGQKSNGTYEVLVFNDDANNTLEWEWKSKSFSSSEQTSFSSARVEGEQDAVDPVEFQLIRGDDVVHTQILENDDAFRLPAERRREISFKIKGTSDIVSVSLAYSMRDL